jgi:allantoin racemase
VKILLANPNTTQAVTDAMAVAARAQACPGTEIVPATASFGARIIGTRAEMAIAEHASLDVLARHAEGCDAAIIGASIDSGLRAAREMLDIPVLGLTEAALHTACLLGGRFGLVVTGARSATITAEMVAGYGLSDRLGGIHGLEAGPLDLLGDPDAAASRIATACRALVASGTVDVVVLIGAVMAGMPARLRGETDVPVLEGVACAVMLAEGLVRLGCPKPRAGSFARLPRREIINLGEALAARFSGPAA